MNLLRFLPVFFLTLIAAQAQLVFTVATTANSTGFGYTAGQVATFSFTVTGANLSANSGGQFFSYTNQWWEDVTSDVQIFTAISGTGLAGTLVRSTVNSNDPFSYIQAIPNQVTFTDGAESSSTASIGLTVGGTGVNYILAGNMDWGATLAMPATYTSLTSYFTPSLGSHTLLGGGYLDIQLTTGTVIHFTATNLTISAVPEPSTVALLGAGLPVIGVLLLRRRRA